MQQHIKRITHHEQVEFIQRMQGWFNIQKSINVIHHIKRIKNLSHTYISIDTEKASDRIQHDFMIKVLNKLGIEESFLYLMKDMSVVARS